MAVACVRSSCSPLLSSLMSPLVVTKPSRITDATAASATPTNARASRSPSCPIQGPPTLTIPVQAEPVAAAEYGLHYDRIAGIFLDLPPQILDMGVDSALVALEVVAADAVNQLEPRVDPAGDRGQGYQDAPFRRSQLDFAAADLCHPPGLVDDQGAVPEPADPLLGRRCRVAAQDRLDPEHQLTRAERLGHVVVGTELEARDAVLLTGLRRQHQDRRRAGRPDLPGDRLARYVRQPEVQHDQVRCRGLRNTDRLSARLGRQHGEPGSFEVRTDKLPELPFVLNKQHGRGHDDPITVPENENTNISDIPGSYASLLVPILPRARRCTQFRRLRCGTPRSTQPPRPLHWPINAIALPLLSTHSEGLLGGRDRARGLRRRCRPSDRARARWSCPNALGEHPETG